MEHFTYTAEFTHPLCPYCSSRVPCDQDDPTVPWIGTCKSGHTAIYELDDELITINLSETSCVC